ncbi:MAG: agmatinase [Elusimicrobiota bacterium]
MKIFPNRKQFVIDSRSENIKKAKFVILPVPYEKTTSYARGTRFGPRAIIDASWQLEFWDEELKKETWKEGFFTTKPLNCNLTEEKFFENLEKISIEILKKTNAVPIFLGGEHSITQGILKGFEKKYRGLSILHFDAHADLRPEYEGNPRSHASALYPASRKTRTVQVGIRNIAPEEKDLINSGKVITCLMHENLNMDSLIKKVLKNLTDTVYITIDIDGFDPSVMPGTGTPQPGGFTWYEALRLFKSVCKKKRIVGIDLVEVIPLKNSNITEFNAAKLIYRLMGYICSRRL